MKIKTPYFFLVLLVWQILLFVFVFSFLQIHFQTSKDVEILLNLSGKLLAQTPNAFVFHTHILISQWLKNLYSLGKIDWYSYFLVALLGISFVSIKFKIWKLRPDWRSVLLIFLFSLLIEIPLLTKLNFEVVAGVLTVAGNVILVNKKPQKLNSIAHLVGFLFLLVAFLLSSSAFILIGIPCFLLVFSQANRKYFKQILLNLFVLMILILSAIAADWYNERAYQDQKAWHIFRERQELNQKLKQIDISTCNEDPDCESTLAKLDWTLNDFSILQNGFAFPNATFSNYKIKTFIEEAHLDYTQKHEVKDREHELLLKKNYNYLIISSLSIFLFSLLLRFKRYKKVLKIVFFAITLLTFSVSSVYYFDFSVYVLSPLWVLLAILPSLWNASEEMNIFELKKLNKFQLLSFSFLLILLVLQLIATLFNQRLKTEHTPKQFVNKTLVQHVQKNPQNLYILWEETPPIKQINPFEKIATKPKNLFWLHKYQQSPALQTSLANFEIRDLYKNLVEKQHVFLVIDNDNFEKLSKIYKLYISEHYDLLIKFERQNKKEAQYGIYKVMPKKL